MIRTIAIGLALLATTALLSACGGSAHLSSDFGQRSRAHFEKQRVSQEPAKQTPDGLDPEEAAIIHGSYRRSIGDERSATQTAEPKVMIVKEDDK